MMLEQALAYDSKDVLAPAAKCLLIVICNQVDAKGFCALSAEELRIACGYSDAATVSRNIQKLREAGFIADTVRSNSCVYSVTPRKIGRTTKANPIRPPTESLWLRLQHRKLLLLSDVVVPVRS